jgi:hypothetical protein
MNNKGLQSHMAQFRNTVHGLEPEVVDGVLQKPGPIVPWKRMRIDPTDKRPTTTTSLRKNSIASAHDPSTCYVKMFIRLYFTPPACPAFLSCF